jgi:MarR family transcriptional regulator, transcriptional regulator for hemolysin
MPKTSTDRGPRDRSSTRTATPGPPRSEPIGLVLARLGKELDRRFDVAMAAAGGSRPTWLILLAVKSGEAGSQTDVAQRVGITGPTLTHHLDRLETTGLIERVRDPANRRRYGITLTTAGNALFGRLRAAAIAHDAQLRTGLSDRDLATLRRVATTMQHNLLETSPAIR